MNHYETDILTWSEHQSRLLRRLAEGERVSDEVDWENVIEEIESVGNEQLHAVRSLLVQALRHMLKAEAWPSSRDQPTWRADAIDFRARAASRFVPSMRQRIDVAVLYRQALRAIPETIDGQPPSPLPAVCPMTLDDLLADKPLPLCATRALPTKRTVQ